MKYEQRTYNPFWRTVICIISIPLISIGFSFSHAMAENCQGGADCLVCVERPHGHFPLVRANMEHPGCPAVGPNNPCGFEASQGPDEFHGIVSAVRICRQIYAGIFAVVSDEYGQTRLTGEFIPQFRLPDSRGTAPIYLLNQSQLC
jgi:hypothetical protein